MEFATCVCDLICIVSCPLLANNLQANLGRLQEQQKCTWFGMMKLTPWCVYACAFLLPSQAFPCDATPEPMIHRTYVPAGHGFLLTTRRPLVYLLSCFCVPSGFCLLRWAVAEAFLSDDLFVAGGAQSKPTKVCLIEWTASKPLWLSLDTGFRSAASTCR